MPNWCSNTVKMKVDAKTMEQMLQDGGYDSDTIAYFFEDATGTILDRGFYAVVVPRPSKEEMESYTEPTADGWYGWSIDHWGTKWEDTDALGGWEDDIATFTMDTAWSPPIKAFMAISKKYDVEIGINFDEGGMAFMGTVVISKGEIVEDVGLEGEHYPNVWNEESDEYDFDVLEQAWANIDKQLSDEYAWARY